ncbi:hypothetical protein [Ensifer soli]|uniref:hypothetical protein n=1 Tax=Ciceribacter sp. sgz301302 TaxID=3342379 RepID=UPI0035B86734
MTKYTHKKIAGKLAAKAATATEEVSPEDVSELKTIGEGIRSLGRRTTEQGFELGGFLARAKAILPERALGAWVKAICKFSTKTARNYIAIHENLADYKERLVAAGITSTALFVLAYADSEKVEDVLAAFEAGEDLTVAQVKTMVGATPPNKEAEENPPEIGGAAGLRRMAEIKIEQDSVKFFQLTTAILQRVNTAMQPLAKNRAVIKKSLQDLIVNDCRHAHDLINSIAAPLEPSMIAGVNWRPSKLPKDSAWRKVQALLYKMGSKETWPAREDFVPWLQNEVVPLLRFVVHGEALPANAEDQSRDDVAVQSEDEADDGLLTYGHMPPAVQDTIEGALQIVSPDNRDEIRAQILFDPRPSKRQYKKLAA